MSEDGKKCCARCKKIKSLEEFHRAKGGRRSACKLCRKTEGDPEARRQQKRHFWAKNKDKINKKRKQWRLDNSDKAKQYERAYRAKNKERMREYSKQWRLDNPDIFKQYTKASYHKHKEKNKEVIQKYRENNKEKIKLTVKRWQKLNKEEQRPKRAAILAKYRASKLQAVPPWLGRELKSEIKQIYIDCPKGYQVDHIVPLQGKNIRGLHVPWNLQYLTAEENQIKGNRF